MISSVSHWLKVVHSVGAHAPQRGEHLQEGILQLSALNSSQHSQQLGNAVSLLGRTLAGHNQHLQWAGDPGSSDLINQLRSFWKTTVPSLP